MKDRIVIVATVLALVMMPCAKISAAYAKTASQSDVSSNGAAIEVATTQTGVEVTASDSEQGTESQCLTCCKQWLGVVSRVEAVAAPTETGKPAVAVWPYHDTWPQNPARLKGFAARSPPDHGGTAFQAFFARTSRFLS